MRRHINYFIYVIRHKWFVLLASWYIGAPMWKALIHDMSKFLPSEWGPYARTFYNSDGSKRYNETEEFNMAWLMHQHRNSHHWQHWLLRMDRGDIIAIQMPNDDVYEMVADWMGAGRAITGKWDVYDWFTTNKDKMTLHPNTMALATKVVNEAYSWYHNE